MIKGIHNNFVQLHALVGLDFMFFSARERESVQDAPVNLNKYVCVCLCVYLRVICMFVCMCPPLELPFLVYVEVKVNSDSSPY